LERLSDKAATVRSRNLDQPRGTRWFAELTNKRIRRGVFRSVKELEAAIREYIEVHKEPPKPFVWTKTADQILVGIARYNNVMT
jgi:hypothetical protein